MPADKSSVDHADAPKRLPAELEQRIHEVAVGLRRREWFRFGVYFAIATFGLTILSTILLRYSDPLKLNFRSILIGFVAGEVGIALILFIARLLKPLSLKTIALYIDEHHPELENRILSAVEFSSANEPTGSPFLIEECLKESRFFVRRISFSDILDQALLTRLALASCFLFASSASIVLFRHDLWFPACCQSSASEFVTKSVAQFTVEPGDARVRLGENQVILVKSEESGRKVSIQWKTTGGDWQKADMSQGSSEKVHHHEFANVREDLLYQVAFGDAESKTFKISTWIPPEVQAIDLTYHYPDYLNRPSREVPNGGNITALEGTRVDLDIQTNKEIKSGTLVLKSGKKIPLERNLPTQWRARVEVEQNDKYHIELVDNDDAPSEFNPQYEISAQKDKPPKITLQFPREDSEVTSLDEIPFTFHVSDDFGLDSFGLQYEIVGKEKQSLPLRDAKSDGVQADGNYTMMLENLGLSAGDLISWTVWAKDRKPGREEDESSDLYFLEIRPFDREFEEAVSNSGGMQGAQGNIDAADQKETMIATWNLRRRAKSLGEQKYKEQRETIMDAQKTLLEKYEAEKTAAAAGSEILTQVKSAMRLAIQNLEAAEYSMASPKLTAAIDNMGNAYRGILKMEPRHAQVEQTRGTSGSSSGKNHREMNELEVNRNRNFYEQEKRTKASQEATEKTLAKIKELAQRQKMINEEIAKLISEMKKAKNEEDRQKLQKQLEKLKEEEKKNLGRLDELDRDVANGEMDEEQARQTNSGLQDVRQQMDRSLKNMEPDRLQQARLASSRAVDGLNELEDTLQKLSRAAASEKMKNLQSQMNELQRKEKTLTDEIKNLKGDDQSTALRPQGASEGKRKELMQQKSDVADQFKNLMTDAGELAEKSEQTQELMSRKLGDWLRKTSADGILEDMQEGDSFVRYGIWDSSAKQEQKVSEKLARASTELDQVAKSLVGDDLEAMEKALDKLRQAMDRQGEKNVASASPNRDGRSNDAGTTTTQGKSAAMAAEKDELGTGKNLRDGSGDAERQIKMGDDFKKEGKLNEAIQRYRNALESDPTNDKAAQKLSTTLAEAGKTSEAMDEQRKAMMRSMSRKMNAQGKSGDKPSASEGKDSKEQSLGKDAQPGTDQSNREAKGGQGSKGEEEGKGSQPGASESDQQSEATKGNRQARQTASGETKGREGSQPGEGENSTSANSSEPSNNNSDSQGRSGNLRQQASGGFDRGGANWSGGRFGWDDWRQPPSPDFMDHFLGTDYQRWVEKLRDAEALLPKDGDYRPEIERIRNKIEDMRRDWRRRALAPKYDLFLADVLKPLAETANQLDLEIRKALKQNEFLLTDEGSVPAQYRKRVADYFESLSRPEGRP